MDTLKNKLLRAAAFSAAVMTAATMTACGNKIDTPPANTQDPAITAPPITTVPPETSTEPTTTEPPPPVEPDPLEKYLDEYETSKDFIGWIKIDGIAHSNGDPYIDYPVVQYTDNEYYLDKNWKGEKSKKGCIYADYKVPITGLQRPDNLTLYGHSNKDGSFFRHVLDYKKLDVVKDAYIINFDTRWEEAQYVIVSCFLVGIYEKHDDIPLFEYFKCRNFATVDEYNYFMDNIMLRNYYLSDVPCEYGDQFLTLSTCSYEFSDSRFVVVARKLRPGEDASVYKDSYKKNPDKHMPKVAR